MSDEDIKAAQREAFAVQWDDSPFLCFNIVRGVYVQWDEEISHLLNLSTL